MTYEVPSVDPTDSYVEFYVRKQKSFCLSDCQIDSYVEPFVDLIPMLIFRYEKNSFWKDLFSNAPNKNEREKHKKHTTTNSSGLIFTERGGVERRRWCGHDRDLLRGGGSSAGDSLLGHFFNSLDILLTPASMIFPERRGSRRVACGHGRDL
jgi:hypothetical protein